MNGSEIFFFGDLQARHRCISCGKCCGIWPVPVTPGEEEKISSYTIPGFPDPKQFFSSGHFAKNGKKCIFLDEKNLCRIHASCGEDAKAFACRLYPLEIHEWEDSSRSVSLRFDCPAAAEGTTGKKLSERLREIEALFQERPSKKCTAVYGPGCNAAIIRLRIIAKAYLRILNDQTVPLPVRVYACACLLLFHADPLNRGDIENDVNFQDDAWNFYKRSIGHLKEVMEEYAHRPSQKALLSFRVLLLGYLRDDTGKNFFRRMQWLMNAVSFASGGGSLEKAGGFGKDLSAKQLTGPAGRLPAEENAFEPYLRWVSGRLLSLHFCGSAFEDLTFEEGLCAMLLQYPFARILASADAISRGEEKIGKENVMRAMIVLDHGFLRHRLFRQESFRKHLRLLVPDYSFASLL